MHQATLQRKLAQYASRSCRCRRGGAPGRLARDKCKHEGSAGTKAADTTLTHHATALRTHGFIPKSKAQVVLHWAWQGLPCKNRISSSCPQRLDSVRQPARARAAKLNRDAVDKKMSFCFGEAADKARTRMTDCAERSAGRSLSHVRAMINTRQTNCAETLETLFFLH